MMARLWWYLDPTSPHQLKKNGVKGPTLTKLSGSAHALADQRSWCIILCFRGLLF